jgi:hypothetical protein
MMKKQKWAEGVQTSVPNMAEVKEIVDKDRAAFPHTRTFMSIDIKGLVSMLDPS